MVSGKINLQGVDLVLSIPQYYLNFNLDQLLKSGTTTSGASLTDIALDLGQNTWIRGKIDKISTKLAVAGSTTKVKLFVAFASGTVDYYDLTKKPPTKEQDDIAGLVFCMDVDLSIKDLADDKSLPADVKAEMKAKLANLGAGSFTIQQFFMDITAAAISQPDPTDTVYPSSFSAAAKAAFPQYMTMVMDELKKAGGDTLGYGIKVDNPGHVADPVATFPPTALHLVTNAYEPQGGARANETLNCVNYLILTGANPTFPANPKPWWGNFVAPDFPAQGMYGAMAISFERFRAFLIEKLGPIACQYVTVNHKTDGLALDTSPAVGRFTPTQPHDLFMGGSFSKKGIAGQSHRTNTFSNDDVDYGFDFEVEMKIQPGTNTVIISRTTHFSAQATHWYGIKNHALKSRAKVVYKFPVTYTIKLLGVSDGALQVDVTAKIPEAPADHVYPIPYGWMEESFSGSFGPFQGPMGTMDAAMNDGASAAFPSAIPDSMKGALEKSLNLHPFVFPGGSQLFMKNPIFTQEGDLLVGLSYKA